MRFLNLITHEVKKIVSLESLISKKYGVSDLLLPVCFIDNGVILNNDGSFSTFYWYSGVDLNSTTDDEISYLNNNIFNSAFFRLGDGWVMHLDLLRKESIGYINENECYFPDATSSLIDIERRIIYNKEETHYENEFVITFTYLPPKDISSKANQWFINDKNKLTINYYEYLEIFKDNVSLVISDISSRVSIIKMSDIEIMSHLHLCINGFEHNYVEPSNGLVDLNYRLATQDITKGFEVKVGEKYVGVVCAGEGFPFKTIPALLHELSTLEFEYRWSTRYIFLSQDTAKRLIDKTIDYYYQNRESVSQMINNKMRDDGVRRENRAASSFAEEAENALEMVETGNYTFGKYTCSIIVFDDNPIRLTDKCKIIQKVLSRVGIVGKIERANAFDAYLGAIPAMVRHNIRKSVVNTMNLANLMPTTSVWAGYNNNPCQYYDKKSPPLFYAVAEGSTPFRGCLHVGDLAHTLIMGPSRSGKSVLLNFLISQHFRYRNAQVYLFDYGCSSMPLCYAMNGKFFDIGADEYSLTFKPLEHLDGNDFNFACKWLEDLVEINGYKLNSTDRVDINEILSLIRKEAKLEQRTLEYFQHQIKARNENVARAIKPYVSSDGVFKSYINKIFNAREDKLSMSNFSVFEIEKLVKMGDNVLVPTILYLLHMITRSLDGKPTLIIFEEAWNIFKFPVLINMLENWLRTVAKKNCGIIFCTQQVSDILKSTSWDLLMDQCQTKIFLPNQNLLSNFDLVEQYKNMGLNDKQIDIIANAIPQQEYYFSNRLGNRLFNLYLSDVAKIFLGKTGLEDLKKAREIKKKYEDSFGAAWLNENGFKDAANYWLKLNNELSQ